MEAKTCPVKIGTPTIGRQAQEARRCGNPPLSNGYCQEHQGFAERMSKKLG